MPAVENGVAVFGVLVGFFFFVSQVWPGSCEVGRLYVVLLSVRIFAFKIFALPIVRLIKIAKVTNQFTACIAIQFQLSRVLCADLCRWCSKSIQRLLLFMHSFLVAKLVTSP